MNNSIFIVGFLLSDFVLLVLIYLFFINRIKDINEKHIRYTKVDGLNLGTNRLIKIIFVLFVTLFISTVFITLNIL